MGIFSELVQAVVSAVVNGPDPAPGNQVKENGEIESNYDRREREYREYRDEQEMKERSGRAYS